MTEPGAAYGLTVSPTRTAAAIGRGALLAVWLLAAAPAGASETERMAEQPAQTRAATDADVALAGGCRGCHGAQAAGALPALDGRDAHELAELLLAFKRDERPATLMNRLAKGYSDAELERIAAVFAANGAARETGGAASSKEGNASR